MIFFVEALVPTISGTLHGNLFHPTVCVTQERLRFFWPYLAHSELVHVYEGMFCDEAPAPFEDFELFLPVIFFSAGNTRAF